MAILEQIDDLLFNLEMTSAAPVGRTGSKDNKGPKSSQKAAVTLSAGSESGSRFFRGYPEAMSALSMRADRSRCANVSWLPSQRLVEREWAEMSGELKGQCALVPVNQSHRASAYSACCSICTQVRHTCAEIRSRVEYLIALITRKV